MQIYSRAIGLALAALAAACLSTAAYGQQKSEINITRQPGILYLPSHVMEKQRLIEKHAAALGVPDLKVNWLLLSGGGNQTDQLLAGVVILSLFGLAVGKLINWLEVRLLRWR